MIIVLNGASSAGKTSAAQALLEMLGAQWVYSFNKSRVYDTRIVVRAGNPHWLNYTATIPLPCGVWDCLNCSAVGCSIVVRLGERVAMQPAQTDVHHFTSLTLPSENRQ